MRIPLLILCAAATSFGQVAELQWHAAGTDGRRYEAHVEATGEPRQLLMSTSMLFYEIFVNGQLLKHNQLVEPEIFDLSAQVPASSRLTLTLVASWRAPPVQAFVHISEIFWVAAPKSAGEIAEAARMWGQNEDITVVKVAYA